MGSSCLTLVPCEQGHQNPPVPQYKHDELPCQDTAKHGGTGTGSSFHPFVLPGFAVGVSVMGSHLAAAGSGISGNAFPALLRSGNWGNSD